MLARAAARAGTHTIVATPHVSWRYRNGALQIEGIVRELNDRLNADRVALDIRPGAEVAATNIPEADPADLPHLSLGGGPWLLLEPPFTPVVTGLDDIVYSLMRRGHSIVIAHPERCAGLHRDPEMLASLVRAGALTSITAGSLTGRFGTHVRRFAMQLFGEGLAHNVASDAHDTMQRPPGMAAEIEQAGLSELREWLTELVPAAILTGDPIPARPALRPPRRRGLVARLRGW